MRRIIFLEKEVVAFFIQHSPMVRRPFRERLARVLDRRYHGAFYSICSGATLLFVVITWQESATTLYTLRDWGLLMIATTSIFIGVVITFAIRSLKTFDGLGLNPIKAHLRGNTSTDSELVIKGPYRWVRHPLYSCVLVLLWTT